MARMTARYPLPRREGRVASLIRWWAHNITTRTRITQELHNLHDECTRHPQTAEGIRLAINTVKEGRT